jgi:hypothetical protein
VLKRSMYGRAKFDCFANASSTPRERRVCALLTNEHHHQDPRRANFRSLMTTHSQLGIA